MLMRRKVSVPCRGLCFFTNEEVLPHVHKLLVEFPSPVGDYVSSLPFLLPSIAYLPITSFRPLSGIMFLHPAADILAWALTPDVPVSVPCRGLCFFTLRAEQAYRYWMSLVVSVPCRGLCFFTCKVSNTYLSRIRGVSVPCRGLCFFTRT